jgi:hypothetical protein
MMDSDQESVSSSSSSSSSSSPSSLSSSSATSYKTIKASIVYYLFVIYSFFSFYLHLSIILQKEVFIWADSELKDIYEINEKQTWAEQKDNIITKLLPPLYKLINKKYSVSNVKLLKMLYGRWRSRHRVNNIKNQGEERMKQDKRRAKKNSKMQDVSKYSINMK